VRPAPSVGWRRRLRAFFTKPRAQRITGAGYVVFAILPCIVPAAILTGNNVLFFAWGLLSGILTVSRLFAVLCIRPLRAHCDASQTPQPRAGSRSQLALHLEHSRGWLTAYGVAGELSLSGDSHVDTLEMGYLLALAPRGAQLLWPSWIPQRRGLLQPTELRLRCAAPFGLVEQSRILSLRDAQPLWCAPRPVDVGSAVRSLASQLGTSPLQQAGRGDDFFSLRPYRAGDDVRRVAWRRSARSGRLLVIEPEAVSAKELMLQLQLQLSAGEAAIEHAIACFCSLGEALLQQGYAVAVHTHGLLLALQRGGRGHRALLLGCARLNPRQPLPALPRRLGALPVVGFAGPGVAGGQGTVHRLRLPAAAPAQSAARADESRPAAAARPAAASRSAPASRPPAAAPQ
jgi:uncharacterized protein (DUF58 family)